MITASTTVQKPKTYWNYSVYAIRAETGEKIDRSLVMTGGASLEDAISRMIADAAYYIGMGYRVEIRDIAEACEACHGEGETRKRRGKFWTDTMVKCKCCKGVGTFTKLGTISQPEFSHGLKITSA
jgi:hypothetical protein